MSKSSLLLSIVTGVRLTLRVERTGFSSSACASDESGDIIGEEFVLES